MASREVDFNSIVGYALRYGVMASFAVVAVGSILLFAEGQTGYSPIGTPAALVSGQDSFLIGIAPLVQGLVSAKPYAIIELGLLILLATPVVRVFISIFLFLKERRYPFVLITITVLALLLFSMFVVGPLVSG